MKKKGEKKMQTEKRRKNKKGGNTLSLIIFIKMTYLLNVGLRGRQLLLVA